MLSRAPWLALYIVGCKPAYPNEPMSARVRERATKTPKRPIRIGLVHSQLRQGGSERYLLEVCRALDKARFSIEVLLTRRLDPSYDHYAYELEKLGIPIFAYEINLQQPSRQRGLAGAIKYLARMLFSLPRLAKAILVLGWFVRRADVLYVIQIENYLELQKVLARRNNVVVGLMSNAFQYNGNVYDSLNPHTYYRFTLMDPSQKQDIREATGLKFEAVYFPLILDFSDRKNAYRRPVGQPFKIGIFVRISPERPVHFFFYALQVLLRDMDAQIYFYGIGDARYVAHLASFLGVGGRIVVRGHAADLRHALVADGITMVWQTCHGEILGYTPIEVASHGYPIVFWNLGTLSYEEILKRTDHSVHGFKDVVEFVQFTRSLIQSVNGLERLGENLSMYVRERYSAPKHICKIEHYFSSVISQ